MSTIDRSYFENLIRQHYPNIASDESAVRDLAEELSHEWTRTGGAPDGYTQSVTPERFLADRMGGMARSRGILRLLGPVVSAPTAERAAEALMSLSTATVATRFTAATEAPRFRGFFGSAVRLSDSQFESVMSHVDASATVRRTSESLHMTLIEPAEFRALVDQARTERELSRGQAEREVRARVEQLAQNPEVDLGEPTITGVGRASADGTTVYYATAEWPGGQRFRERLGLGAKDFHVTLASTATGEGGVPRDVHGVSKSEPNVAAFREFVSADGINAMMFSQILTRDHVHLFESPAELYDMARQVAHEWERSGGGDLSERANVVDAINFANSRVPVLAEDPGMAPVRDLHDYETRLREEVPQLALDEPALREVAGQLVWRATVNDVVRERGMRVPSFSDDFRSEVRIVLESRGLLYLLDAPSYSVDPSALSIPSFVSLESVSAQIRDYFPSLAGPEYSELVQQCASSVQRSVARQSLEGRDALFIIRGPRDARTPALIMRPNALSGEFLITRVQAELLIAAQEGRVSLAPLEIEGMVRTAQRQYARYSSYSALGLRDLREAVARAGFTEINRDALLRSVREALGIERSDAAPEIADQILQAWSELPVSEAAEFRGPEGLQPGEIPTSFIQAHVETAIRGAEAVHPMAVEERPVAERREVRREDILERAREIARRGR